MNWYELKMSEITVQLPMFEELTVPVKWLNVDFAPTTVDLHDDISIPPRKSNIRVYFNMKDPERFKERDNVLWNKSKELLPDWLRYCHTHAAYNWRYTIERVGMVSESDVLNIPKVLSYIDNVALEWRVYVFFRGSFSTEVAIPAATVPVLAPVRLGDSND